MSDISVGLSFGDTSAVIAICKDGKADVVANDVGDRTTPAMVSYNEDDVVVGLPAKQNIIRNAKNTVSNFYSLLGLKMSDERAKEALKQNKYCKATEGADGSIVFQVPTKEGSVTPVQAATRVCAFMKTIADSYTGGKSNNSIVVAVPPYFKDDQIAALREALSAAGFKVMRFISEPTAAVLAYGIAQEDRNEDANILVFDVGGTKTTASVVAARNGTFRTVTNHIDRDLAGFLFDETLVDVLAQEFKKTSKLDVKGEARPMIKLAVTAETVKLELSTKTSSSVTLDGLFEGMDLRCSVARSKFEISNRKLFAKVGEVIAATLAQAGLAKENIDKVVLCGGMSRVPKLKTTVEAFFERPIVLDSISADEAIAVGASIQASLLADSEDDGLNESMTTVSATPFDISLKTGDASFATIVAASTPFPVKRSVDIALPQGQNSVKLSLVEARKEGAAGLVDINLKDLTVKESGAAVTLTVEISKTGEAKVTAKDAHSDKSVTAALNK